MLVLSVVGAPAALVAWDRTVVCWDPCAISLAQMGMAARAKEGSEEKVVAVAAAVCTRRSVSRGVDSGIALNCIHIQFNDVSAARRDLDYQQGFKVQTRRLHVRWAREWHAEVSGAEWFNARVLWMVVVEEKNG